MAKPQRMIFFKIQNEDRPGVLLEIMKELKAKNIALVGLSGHGTQPGQADIYLLPKKPEKPRAAWKASGRAVEEGTGFFLKGADKTGALLKDLEAISKAGVNIVSLHAIAVGGKYGSFVQVAPHDVEKTAKALGAK